MRAQKKFRYYLYGTYFLIVIDERRLLHQLNQPTLDLQGAIVGRWLDYIRLFSFDIRHVPGTTHKGPDALSLRLRTEEEFRKLEERREEAVRQFEEFVDRELGAMTGEQACSGFCTDNFHSFSLYFPLFDGGAGEFFCFSFNKGVFERDEGLQKVGEYLTTMRRPVGMADGDFKGFRGFALKFLVRDGILYRRGKAGMPPRRVLVKEEDKWEVLKHQHDKSVLLEAKLERVHYSKTKASRTSLGGEEDTVRGIKKILRKKVQGLPYLLTDYPTFPSG